MTFFNYVIKHTYMHANNLEIESNFNHTTTVSLVIT